MSGPGFGRGSARIEPKKEPVLRGKDGLLRSAGSVRLDQKDNLRPKRAVQGAKRLDHLLNAVFTSPPSATIAL